MFGAIPRSIIDLARYLLPTPPVPSRWRRPMLALGGSDPTRAICSSLIAQAFQSVRPGFTALEYPAELDTDADETPRWRRSRRPPRPAPRCWTTF